jgi:pimeloyl-ACP methyl ester carboxylesterase
VASRIRYARNGDVNIAYRTLGDGPRDLLFVAGTITNLDVMWEDAGYRRFCERLASFSRLVTFDKRGMGLSERVEAGTMEDRMDDVRAILDAIGSERAHIMGVSEGGLLAELFAASHPHRSQALILVGAEVREENDDEWRWGDGTREWFEDMMSDWSDWGEGAGIEHLAPSLAGDPAARELFGRLQLMAGNPRTIEAHMRVAFGSDMRPIVQTIRVPTLVIHRRDDRAVHVNQGRYLAEHIPGAKYVELAGVDHLPWVGADDILAEIEEFVTGVRPNPEPDRILATILFTDVVASTQRAAELGDARWRHLLEAFYAAVRRELGRFHGREVDTAGDGLLASFDGPARAIRCADAIRRAVRPLGLQVRTGLHTGECEMIGDKLGGIAVHIGARVAALAQPDEILVSGTLHDLVAGSGIGFEDRGLQSLRGVPGDWRIYAVAAA